MQLGMIDLNVVTFAIVAFQPFSAATLVRAGALFEPATLSGEWWRLFSALFLHANLLHLAVNMYGLWMLGRFFDTIGRKPVEPVPAGVHYDLWLGPAPEHAFWNGLGAR